MSRPTISIVTPNYNGGRFLDQTIRSVLAQDYPSVEYLVFDGGSTDESVEIIRRHADQISHWCSEKDNGQSDAIAKGFCHSTGDVLGWINSDDVLLPGALSAVARYFEQHPSVDVVSGGAYRIDENGAPIQSWFGSYTLGVAASYNRFRYYEQDGVYQQATFWRRSAYEAVGGLDPTLQFIMDRDLFARLAQRQRFGRTRQMLACFRIHESCKTMTMESVRQRESKALQQRHGVMTQSRLLRGLMYYRYRIPSLFRKVWLRGLLLVGRVRLEAIQ